jgi:FAD/FMN-containing dehydrogenase
MTTLDTSTSTSTSASDISIPSLRAAVSGRVIAPGDADYDAARTVTSGAIDRRPAVIVKVADADDVQAVVKLARDTGHELAIRSGGHSAAGHSVSDGGIVLDLSDMKGIEIDVEGRTAWAETGLTAAEYTAAVGEHGLVTGFGDTGSVGIGGITLGGGVGYLVRKFGLTIDDLLAAEVVTADGRLLHVDADTEPDLFWAIRGGGGNFGVATRFRFRLHELPSIVGGMLILPATPETVEGFMSIACAAPDELSTIANVMNCPPMPFVPEELHGTVVILAFITYAGDAAAGERAIAPLRALATPIADMVQPMPYGGMYQPEDPDYHPTAAARTLFMDRVDRGDAELIVERLTASDATLRAVQLRALGGAMARVPSDATAFAHRDSKIMVNVAAFYDGPEDKVVREAWVTDLAIALEQDDRGAYVNFVADEGEERVRAAYPGRTWDRLAAIKARFDPTNLFRLNQNITPSIPDGD